MTRLVAVRPSFRADFSHDPEDAGRLLARVTTDADVAIAIELRRRRRRGRELFRRRQLTPWGNRMARWIAGLKGVRDCTAGFKAIRTSALLHRLLHSGARVDLAGATKRLDPGVEVQRRIVAVAGYL